MFQFLIGAMRLGIPLGNLSESALFQFLIGAMRPSFVGTNNTETYDFFSHEKWPFCSSTSHYVKNPAGRHVVLKLSSHDGITFISMYLNRPAETYEQVFTLRSTGFFIIFSHHETLTYPNNEILLSYHCIPTVKANLIVIIYYQPVFCQIQQSLYPAIFHFLI